MTSTGIVFALLGVGAIVVTLGCGGRTSLDGTGASVTETGGNGGLGGVGGANTGGANTGGANITNLTPPLNQQVLFEATYRSDTPENAYQGTYVTRDGDVYAFDYYAYIPRSQPVPLVGTSMASADFMSQYGYEPTLIGHIDQAELFRKFEPIRSMRTALVVQKRADYYGNEVTLKAWEYDDSTQMYSAVRLWGCGDFLILNLSDLAGPLVDWLCGLDDTSLPMCCETQILPLSYTDCSWCDSSGTSCVANTNGLKYCSSFYHCGKGCECEPVCAGGPTYCRDGGDEGLYCSES